MGDQLDFPFFPKSHLWAIYGIVRRRQSLRTFQNKFWWFMCHFNSALSGVIAVALQATHHEYKLWLCLPFFLAEAFAWNRTVFIVTALTGPNGQAFNLQESHTEREKQYIGSARAQWSDGIFLGVRYIFCCNNPSLCKFSSLVPQGHNNAEHHHSAS